VLGLTNQAAVVEAARAYEDTFTPNGLTAAPVRHLAVLTCMDARLDLFRLLGLQIGDAHLLRNAGGRATDDAIRSLVLSAHALGTREYVVIHHTGCGLQATSNARIQAMVTIATGADASGIDFLPFDDEDASVREDVARIRACPLLPADATVWGAVYEVETGHLRLVD
jgi:carbonic anhydrase